MQGQMQQKSAHFSKTSNLKIASMQPINLKDMICLPVNPAVKELKLTRNALVLVKRPIRIMGKI